MEKIIGGQTEQKTLKEKMRLLNLRKGLICVTDGILDSA